MVCNNGLDLRNSLNQGAKIKCQNQEAWCLKHGARRQDDN